MSTSNKINGMEPEYTEWFPATIKPARPGLYEMSYDLIVNLGSGYALWDGEKWSSYKNWDNYKDITTMVWRGISEKYCFYCTLTGINWK